MLKSGGPDAMGTRGAKQKFEQSNADVPRKWLTYGASSNAQVDSANSQSHFQHKKLRAKRVAWTSNLRKKGVSRDVVDTPDAAAQ